MTLAGIERLIKEEKPQLIVVTGDIIYSLAEHGATNPDQSFLEFVRFIDSFAIPHAITFGNHDTENQWTRSDLRLIYEQNSQHQAQKKHSFIVDDRESYVLEISRLEDPEDIHLVYIIDSGDYSGVEESYYAWILPEQIEWFYKTACLYSKTTVKKDT